MRADREPTRVLPHALSSGAVGAIRRTSAVDTVIARISLAVDLGLLAPNERLPSAADMAAGLEVSEITVRRALTQLQRSGLVERRRGRGGGTYVAANPTRGVTPQASAYRADADRVRQLIDERIVLEVGLAHFACDNRSDADIAAMDDLIDEMAASETWAHFHRGDEAFHLRVASSAGLSRVVPLHRRTLSDLYSYFLPYPIAYLHTSNDDHRIIRGAIADRDHVAAAEAVRAHASELHESMFIGFPELDKKASSIASPDVDDV